MLSHFDEELIIGAFRGNRGRGFVRTSQGTFRCEKRRELFTIIADPNKYVAAFRFLLEGLDSLP
jgi:hypothetical protein